MIHRASTAREFRLRVVAGVCSLISLGLSIHAIVVATSSAPAGREWFVRWAFFGGMAGIFSWRASRGEGSLAFVFGILAAMAWLLDCSGPSMATLGVLVGLCLAAVGMGWSKAGAAEPR